MTVAACLAVLGYSVRAPVGLAGPTLVPAAGRERQPVHGLRRRRHVERAGLGRALGRARQLGARNGTGLGLSVSLGQAKAVGGALRIAPSSSSGTTMELLIRSLDEQEPAIRLAAIIDRLGHSRALTRRLLTVERAVDEVSVGAGV